MKEIRLGTIGTGFIVHSILDAVKKTSGIDLEAVCSRSSEKGSALADKYGTEKVYTHLEDMLSDNKINTVYIASPNMLHYKQAKMALLSGKNVICEKPFCTKSSQTYELEALARQSGLFLTEAVPTAFLPNMELLKELLPKIGRIRLCMSNYSQYSSRYDMLKEGIVSNVFSREYGGGCLMDINYYNVYLNTALFGKPVSTCYYPNIYKDLADISGILTMQYEDFVSSCAGAKDTWGVNYFQIEGDEGYIYVEGGSNGLKGIRFVTKTSEEYLNLQEDPDRYIYEINGIVRMFLENDKEKSESNMKVTVSVMEILEEIRRKSGIIFPDDEL